MPFGATAYLIAVLGHYTHVAVITRSQMDKSTLILTPCES